MLKVTIVPDLKGMEATMRHIEREQMPFATALALTRTAKFVEQKIREEMPRAFDRPTAFTLNSLRTKTATKRELWAEVKVKDESVKATPPIRWLSPQIYGGTRGPKRFEQRLRAAGVLGASEYVVPASGAKIDSNGNMNKGQMVAILSDLAAHWDAASNSTKASRAKRASRRKRGGIYFYLRTARGKLKRGIYERIGTGFGSAVRPVLIITGAQRYRKRLRFFEIAEKVSKMRFPLEFNLAMRQAVRTAMARAA
jgi:hypothetical protein